MPSKIGLQVFGVSACAMVAIHIASIVIGAQYVHVADNVCSGSNISFNLAAWLLYGGIVALVENFLTILLIVAMLVGGVSLGMADEFNAEFAMLCGGCSICTMCCLLVILLPMSIFWLAWFITGTVLIATVSPACSHQFVSVYVMAVIALIFQAIAIVHRCCMTTQTKQRDTESS